MCYNALHMKDTLTIRLPGNLRKALQAMSRAEKVPVSDLVRASIRSFVALRQFRRLRAKVLPFAEAQGLLTDDEVFRAIS